MNDRGRVPFALLGVLLVLTSTTIAVTTVSRTPIDSPSIDDAMDGATAAAVTELRGAADDAATEASIAPVIEPADSEAGEALSEDQPFRDALRLRIYLRAAERIQNVEMERGGVTVDASLPAVEPTTAGYRTAIERVDVERTGEDDAAIAVEIDGVTLTASRNGRTVTTVERTPTFVISNPALLLHDRTDRFERRANAPVTQNGLGQRLTARLYPIAWTRGYAQYGGAPIATVLGTRHVELTTNDALLAEQQAVFGEADPDGHRGVAAAGRRVATTDMIVGMGGDEDWVDTVLNVSDDVGSDPPPDQPVGTWREEPDDPTVTVGVNGSADRAFTDVIGIDGQDEVEAAISRAHTVEARTIASSRYRGQSRWGSRSPGADWSRASSNSRTSINTYRVSSRGDSQRDWQSIESGTFDVTITRRTTRHWERDNETTSTTTVRKRYYRVKVTAQARTVSIDGVPDGRLDGRLEGATDRAVENVLNDVNGLRGAAKRAARGRSIRSTTTETADRPLDRTIVEADLGRMRDRTRGIESTVPAPSVGTGRANPAKRLEETVADRREELLGRSSSTARERTIRAARLAYLDSLEAELDRRASTFETTGDGVGAALGEYLPNDRIDGALAAHRASRSPSPEPIVDPAGELTLAVDTAPSYLTTSEVTRDRIDERGGGTVYPLSTKTVNVFSSPHGQVANGIFSRIPFLGTDRVSLSTAARTLAATDLETTGRSELEAEVDAATAHVRGELTAELIDAGVPEHRANAALQTDASIADEALMLTNGTTVERAAGSISGPLSRQRIELRLRTRLDTALESDQARPTEPTTTAVQQNARAALGGELEQLLADGVDSESERVRKRALGTRMGALPAGLPLAPIPGYWFATANVWYVELTGEYERFAVRSNRGDGTAATTYLRDNRTVQLTHDGRSQPLGTAAPVSFGTRTAVVVVVPPGPRGVGDTDGMPVKASPGWNAE